MIDRYSREEMKKIWDLNTKFDYYLKVELAVCEAYTKTGKIPKKDFEEIKKRAKFNIERIDEIEREVRHDVIAFLTCVNESLGEDLSRHMHIGMTSSDVIDTAFALQIHHYGVVENLYYFVQPSRACPREHIAEVGVANSHPLPARASHGFKKF